MAARLNPKTDARTRDAIQTVLLVKRLEAFALEKIDPVSKRPVEMTRDRVSAALGLLRKTMPDLAVTQLQGEGGGPVIMQIVTGVPRQVEED